MSDMRQNTPHTPPPAPKSNSSIIFIVGGLVVAVAVLAYVFTGDTVPDGAPDASGSAPSVSIENNTTTPAAPAPAEPAPAEPAPAPAPAEPAPAPAAPAPAP